MPNLFDLSSTDAYRLKYFGSFDEFPVRVLLNEYI